MSTDHPLSTSDLELVYDRLSETLDKLADDQTALFLVKLALLQANAIGSAQAFEKHLEAALLDLAA